MIEDKVVIDSCTLYHADCFDVFPFIEDKSIDAIICDLPYGTTACKWDTIIPFEPLWAQYKRIIKDNGAIVLFGSQPFTSALVMSNPKMFKYELIWDKMYGRQPQLANIQPMKRHENILVFGKSRLIYNPQKTKLDKPYTSTGANNSKNGVRNDHKLGLKKQTTTYTHKTPDSVIQVKPFNRGETQHPTQKPVALFEYLIKTYTNEGDMVLDNTMGSGTTNLACLKLNRKSIGIEKEKQYFDIAVKRVQDYKNELTLF